MSMIDSMGANRNRALWTLHPDKPASSRCRRRLISLLAAPVVVVSLSLFAPPLMAQPTVVSAASYQSVIAPGSLATLFGSNLAPQTVAGAPAADGSYPKQLGGITVTVGGAAADLVLVAPSQINFVVPVVAQYGTLNVVVALGAQTVATASVSVSPTAPAIFATDASGKGFGAILNGIDFTQPPFNLTTQMGAGSPTTTIVAVYGTGFRFAGGSAVSAQSGDVSSHVSASVSNAVGTTWTLPVLYAGPAPGYEGLDQINVQLTPDLDTASDLTLTIFADSVPSNPVYLWLRRSPGPAITAVAPTSASPGASLTVAGTGLLGTGNFNASARESLFFVLPSGQQFSSQLSNFTSQSVSARVPALPTDTTDAYYYGNAQLCVVVDTQRSCSPSTFSIIPPPATGQQVGSMLLSWQQQAVNSAIGTLPGSTDPALVSTIQTAAQDKLNTLQQEIADALAGHPDTFQVTDTQGVTHTVVLDLSAIRKIESLLAVAPSPVSEANVIAKASARAALSGAGYSSSSCGLTGELGMAGAINAYNFTVNSVDFVANDLRGIADKALQGCLQAVATSGESAFSGACLDLEAGLSELEGQVDIALLPIDYGFFVAQMIQEQDAIFLQSIQVSPNGMSLSPSSPMRYFSVTGSLVSKGWQQSADELVDKLVSDFITSKIVDEAITAGTEVCPAGACVDVGTVCPSCASQYYAFVNTVANAIGNPIALYLKATMPPLPPAAPPWTIGLGQASLSIDRTWAPAVLPTLACKDGNFSSVTMNSSTTATNETLIFRADQGNLLLLDPSSIPIAHLGIVVNNTNPAIRADRSSYSQSDSATITGSNFPPATGLSLSLRGNGLNATLVGSLTVSAGGIFQQIVTFPATAVGSYQIVASYPDGSQSASVGITIQASPVASFVMSSGGQSANSGSVLNLGVAQGGTLAVVFDGSLSSGSIATWVWQNNGTALPCSGSKCSYTVSSGTPNNTIKLTVTNSAGQSASAIGQVNLSVQSSPPRQFTLTAEAPVCNQTPPPGPAVRLDWTLSANASNYDVYRNGSLSFANVSGLTFNNDSGLVAGQTNSYFIQAKNTAGTSNSNTVTVTIPSTICTTAQPPAASTGSATLVTATSATLGGTVNPNGLDTHFWFLYGTSSSLSGASQTPSQDLGSGTSASGISANIAGLAGNTPYYFQLQANNSAGTVSGSINNFNTIATAPPAPTGLTP